MFYNIIQMYFKDKSLYLELINLYYLCISMGVIRNFRGMDVSADSVQ